MEKKRNGNICRMQELDAWETEINIRQQQKENQFRVQITKSWLANRVEIWISAVQVRLGASLSLSSHDCFGGNE